MGHSTNSKTQLNVYQNTPDNLECYVSMAELLRPKKKAKKNNLSTITLGYLHSRKGSFEPEDQKDL